LLPSILCFLRLPQHSTAGLMALTNDYKGLRVYLSYEITQGIDLRSADRTKENRMFAGGEFALGRPGGYADLQAGQQGLSYYIGGVGDNKNSADDTGAFQNVIGHHAPQKQGQQGIECLL